MCTRADGCNCRPDFSRRVPIVKRNTHTRAAAGTVDRTRYEIFIDVQLTGSPAENNQTFSIN